MKAEYYRVILCISDNTFHWCPTLIDYTHLNDIKTIFGSILNPSGPVIDYCILPVDDNSVPDEVIPLLVDDILCLRYRRGFPVDDGIKAYYMGLHKIKLLELIAVLR